MCIVGLMFVGCGLIGSLGCYVSHGHLISMCFIKGIIVMCIGGMLISLGYPKLTPLLQGWLI